MLHRFLLSILMGLPFLAFSQGINGGFEDLSPNGIPVGWSIADPSGASATKDAHIGKVAAKAWVCKTYLPGIWNSKMDVATGNASEVTGYYKYLGESSECEKATVSYLLGARSADGGIDTMAFGDTELKLSNNYRKFSLSVASQSSGSPEFVNIQFQPAGHCNIHGEENSCFLYVDDIVLAGSTSVKSAPNEEETEPTVKGKKGKKGEIEEEDGGGNDTLAVPMENKGQLESEVEVKADEVEAVEAAEESPAEEGTAEENADPTEEATEEAPEMPIEEESSEPIDEAWDSEEESSDGGH